MKQFFNSVIITFLICLASLSCFSQVDISFEKKIEMGLPKIARYYDSLSFYYSKRHYSLFYIDHDYSIECIDNYTIIPLYHYEDLEYKRFNYVLSLYNRIFILDSYFDNKVKDKYRITDQYLNYIKHELSIFDKFIIESRVVLNYTGCEQNLYLIDYSKGSRPMRNPSRMQLPLLDYNQFMKGFKK